MRKRTPLSIIVLALVVVVSFLTCLFSDVGLALFNFALGNQVYALTVKYQPSAVYYQSEVVSVSFHWIFTLKKAKVPIETILRNYKTGVVGEPSFSLENKTFTLTLNTLVWTANNIKLFRRTFTFEDVEPQQIIIYLHNLSYNEVTIEINGNCNLNGTETNFSVGEALEAT